MASKTQSLYLPVRSQAIVQGRSADGKRIALQIDNSGKPRTVTRFRQVYVDRSKYPKRPAGKR